MRHDIVIENVDAADIISFFTSIVILVIFLLTLRLSLSFFGPLVGRIIVEKKKNQST